MSSNPVTVVGTIVDHPDPPGDCAVIGGGFNNNSLKQQNYNYITINNIPIVVVGWEVGHVDSRGIHVTTSPSKNTYVQINGICMNIYGDSTQCGGVIQQNIQQFVTITV